ncbi:MAG: TraR/DksA C4-type zinc finger protein [Patescibacteria group bacterium]|nr:TraR/DksA C4-type zinc finger protein [Patescibacteria group bacterium]
MDTQKTEHFKGLLLEEEQRLIQELTDLGSKDPNKPDVDYPESQSNSEEDNAAEVTEFVDMLSVEARMEAELKDVKKALEMIEKGQYGICKYCGKEIDEKRLEARPASSSCIACKKVLTQEM